MLNGGGEGGHCCMSQKASNERGGGRMLRVSWEIPEAKCCPQPGVLGSGSWGVGLSFPAPGALKALLRHKSTCPVCCGTAIAPDSSCRARKTVLS